MMKRILLSLLFVASWAASHGQCSPGASNAYFEDFDGASVNATSTGTPGWTLEGGLSVSAPNSYRGRFSFADTAYLTLPSFDATGNTFVLLDFDHICKVSFFDRAQIQYSIDGGNTWGLVDSSMYLGPALTFKLSNNSSFSSFDYTDWLPGVGQDTVTPTNSWWKHENFDISSAVGGQADVRLRFIVYDYDAGFPNGMAGNYGWVLDNINVCMAPCELVPPSIVVNTALTGTIYNTGPFTPVAAVTDANGIAYTEMNYNVNGGPFISGIAGNNCPPLPNFCYNDIPVSNIGDSICYFIVAFDGSACTNTDTSATYCFIVAEGVKPSNCENFDVTPEWTATTTSGTGWEWGAPNFGTTNSAHSAPNAWDIGLTTGYTAGSEGVIVSPVYDFSDACNPSLDFWYNMSLDGGNIGNDGVQLQWTNDPTGATGWTVLGAGPSGFPSTPDPNGTNWYNTGFVNAFAALASNDGWSGNSNGWVNATYNLRSVSGLPSSPAIRFRFLFASDNSGEGFSIDDFCVLVPPSFDASVSAFTLPAGSPFGVVAGQTIPVCVEMTNTGNASITTTTIGCSVNGVPTTTFTFTGNLNCGQATAICLDSIVVPSSSFILACYIDDALDGNHANDTSISEGIIVPILNLSYCDDFEGANQGWTQTIATGASGITKWTLGTSGPNEGLPAHSGTVNWYIENTSPTETEYANNADCFLFSPYFDFSAAISSKLQFWQYHDSEENWDGINLEYSIDNGSSFTLLGTQNDPNATNWYNTQLNSINLDGWSGSTPQWQLSTYTLCNNPDFNNQPNPVQFRFRFASDGTVIDGTGGGIDDFCIYSTQTDDIGVSAITSPVNAAPAGDTISLVVTVCNYGGTIINSFPVGYTINGQQQPPFTANVTLNPCNCISVTLPAMIVPDSNFVLCAYTGLLSDADHNNDTTCGSFVSVQTFVPLFCDNFDGASATFYAVTDGNTATNWEAGIPNNTNGVTIGAYSAPNAWDINLSSNYGNDADASLYTPFFDMSTVVNATMSFWQNRAIGGFNDGMYIEYSSDNGGTWSTLGTVNDTNAVNWYNLDPLTNGQPGWNDYSSGTFGVPLWIESQYNLNGFSNSQNSVQFRFRFVSAAFGGGDGVSIDNFCITVPPPQDAGIAAVPSPTGFLGGNTAYTISALLKNYGSQPFSSCVIKYTTTSVPPCTGTYNWSGAPLLPNQSLLLTNIGSCASSGNVDFGLCVWTELPNDGRTSNDSICKNIDVVPVFNITYNTPYFEDFDSTDGGWTQQLDPTGDPGTIWEWGTPNFGATTGAHSAPNCWDVNLNSAYTGDAFTYLYSPYFNFSNAVNARVKFWHNFNSENGWDGVNLQYSIDGTNWIVLGENADTCSNNPLGVETWYNDALLNSSQQPGWTTNSNGWTMAEYDLNCKYAGVFDNTGVVQFRFQFTADGTIETDGYSMDDFTIEVPIPLSVSPKTITAVNASSQGYLLFPGIGTQFTAGIKNLGTTVATTMNVTLSVDNQIIVTDAVTFSPGIATDSIRPHTFSVNPILSPGLHQVCVWTDSPNGSVDLNQLDDTTCTSVTVFDSTTAYPYCNDFESGSQWVTANALSYIPNNSWELGTPSQTFLNGAHSGTKAWTLGTTTDYANSDTAGLFSLLTVSIGNHCYKISFWHQFRFEEFQDGGMVEYSVDFGDSWRTVNFDQVYGNSDNYDYVTALSSLGNINRGFTGASLGWKYSEKVIRPGQTAPMIFRWRFESDGSRIDEGWSIDDVCIIDLGTCAPLGVDDMTASGLGLGQNHPNPFTGSTTIEYTIPSMGDVQLIVTDALGKVVSSYTAGDVQPGDYQYSINEGSLKAGIYFYTLIFEGEKITKRMMVTE